ncbi:DUF805 domain-containing protein [Flavivirga spongiicola]|uniref:DUF805 domain-containing protein n=1 Tax=Flavivirga spongiicola TaxID=421621 RepID=A0ABU7XT08_9FLAO|nr:DUF805 domain-containing protein [Flavivirga sp. MEBiC05379]MDO5978583.1 DUF805 domain-containing protein [Flavivirga sp. MEBiC05379]
MFKNPFSFSGRIRRLEYGLTYLFCISTLILFSSFIEASDFSDSIFSLFVLIAYWILLAQGSKRCHDLGNSGFYQVIPFYILFMLFNDGQNNENKYGLNPKSKEYLEKKRSFKFPVVKKISRIKFIEIITVTLLLALILGINNLIFPEYDTYLTLSYFLMPIPGFIFLLYISYYKKSYPEEKSGLVNQQLVFAVFYYLTIRLYNIVFRLASFDLETIIFELILILFIFGLTYISLKLYSSIFNHRLKDV